jgi:NitT/TauT family transport system ATP-binding protein
MNHCLLELKEISQSYESSGRLFTAIQALDLCVTEDNFISIVGPTGCGKSTLLRIITGLQKPSTGQVLYRGTPLTGVNPHATLVFQTFALFPWLTLQQNVEVALEARGVPTLTREKRAVELLDRVGLDGFENAYPREISGGMRQKVGFARAMAVEPELLCLDEPFSALDVLSAELLRGDLLELWLGGQIPTKAILMVSHNIEEATLMSDRIVVMQKDPGRIVADLQIDLPHPRSSKDPKFIELVDRTYATLAGQTAPEHVEVGKPLGEPGPTRTLPDVTINKLVSLMEHLASIPGERTDLYRLAPELKLNSDYLLRLTEAAEMLRFAEVSHGDISLTSLGETLAEASILARKEIFASRLRRLPLFKWLLERLQGADEHRIDRDEVQAALEEKSHPVEVERQLETAINWGRYAELFVYDDNTKTFYIEPSEDRADDEMTE